MTDPALTARLVASVRAAAKVPADVAVQAESRLVEDLDIDSLDLVSVLLNIQDEFDVVIDEADVPQLARIADLADYVERRASAPAA